MYQYVFPMIWRIDDVLPAIKGRDEFIVAEREYFDVVNYVVATNDTFLMAHDYDYDGYIRRECRGLIFNKQGEIISRPYHKFFNIGEREEFLPENVDMNVKHSVLEKLDGSMVRPLIINDKVELGTKMGLTDIAADATALLSPNQKKWLRECVERDITPILEYVSPFNKIVVHYDRPRLVLTAIRDNIHGSYYNLKKFDPSEVFEHVQDLGNIFGSDLTEHVVKTRGQTGIEGNVVRFFNGHMLKAKNDWYVHIHRLKDKISSDKNILECIINKEIDDVYPFLDIEDKKRITDFELDFWDMFCDTMGRIEGLYKIALTVYGGDKKLVALDMVPHLIKKGDAQFLFKMLDAGDTDLRELMVEKVKKNLGSGKKYDELMDWLAEPTLVERLC